MPFILAIWVVCGVNIGRLILTQEHDPRPHIVVTHAEIVPPKGPTGYWEGRRRDGAAYTVPMNYKRRD